jgi:multisubunit Na+/H+ antiporter MnhB subunit
MLATYLIGLPLAAAILFILAYSPYLSFRENVRTTDYIGLSLLALIWPVVALNVTSHFVEKATDPFITRIIG